MLGAMNRGAVGCQLLMCIWIPRTFGFGFTEQISAGAMFDESSTLAKSAFNFELDSHNKAQSRFRLSSVTKELGISDIYAVTTTICNMLGSGIYGLIGTHSAQTLNSIKSYTAVFHLPFITTGMAVNMSARAYGYELYMSPYYARALVDLILHYEWMTVYYIYNNREGLYRFEQLNMALADGSHQVQLILSEVVDSHGAYSKIKDIEKATNIKEDVKFILDLTTPEIEEILERQIAEPYKRIRSHFLLANLNMMELKMDANQRSGLNMTGLRIADPQNPNFVRFFEEWKELDGDLLEGTTREKVPNQVALLVDSVTLLAKTVAEIKDMDESTFGAKFGHRKTSGNLTERIDCDAEPVVHWRYGEQIAKMMRETEFFGLSGKVAFDKFGLRKDYSLDILEVTYGRELTKVGTWTPSKGIDVHTPPLEQRKGNTTFANKTRIITTINAEPYVIVGEGEGNARFTGYCVDLIKKIAEKVGFEYEIMIVKDKEYGKEVEPGVWNGMVGELLTGAADLAIAPLTITADRERVVKFSKPFMTLGISIMVYKQSKADPGVFSFMYPLSYEIWMCIIFAYIGVSVVLFLVNRFSPFEWHIEDSTEGPSVTNNFTIFNSLWFSLGAFMQQGVDIEPRSISGRIVGSVWWFFTLIIISSYTANLAAFLTVERMQSPIESAEDLAKQIEIKYGTLASGSTREFFAKSTVPTYERMYQFMLSTDSPVFQPNNSAGIEKVRQEKGRYAFILESTTNEFHNQQLPCNTMKVGNNLDSKGYGVAMPMGSDLRDHITLAVLDLRENGDLKELENIWWIQKGNCSPDANAAKKEGTNSLQLGNVAGIFYILVGGLALSLIMAVLEFLYKSKVEAGRRKTSFTTAARSKARLSIKGHLEKQSAASTSQYSYAPAALLISLDGYADTNTHTQV